MLEFQKLSNIQLILKNFPSQVDFQFHWYCLLCQPLSATCTWLSVSILWYTHTHLLYILKTYFCNGFIISMCLLTLVFLPIFGDFLSMLGRTSLLVSSRDCFWNYFLYLSNSTKISKSMY